MRLVLVAYAGLLLSLVYLADVGGIDSFVQCYKRVPMGDKVGHFLLMGMLCFLANLVSNKRLAFGRHGISQATIIVLLVVFFEELSQLFFSSRTFSLLDLAADVLGIWVFGLAAERIKTLLPALQPKPAPSTANKTRKSARQHP